MVHHTTEGLLERQTDNLCDRRGEKKGINKAWGLVLVVSANLSEMWFPPPFSIPTLEVASDRALA